MLNNDRTNQWVAEVIKSGRNEAKTVMSIKLTKIVHGFVFHSEKINTPYKETIRAELLISQKYL